MDPIQCLVNKGFLTPEQGALLSQVVVTLPSNKRDLYAMYLAAIGAGTDGPPVDDERYIMFSNGQLATFSNGEIATFSTP
jgi:hypothetical protein